jgi:hypothetical protein
MEIGELFDLQPPTYAQAIESAEVCSSRILQVRGPARLDAPRELGIMLRARLPSLRDDSDIPKRVEIPLREDHGAEPDTCNVDGRWRNNRHRVELDGANSANDEFPTKWTEMGDAWSTAETDGALASRALCGRRSSLASLSVR